MARSRVRRSNCNFARIDTCPDRNGGFGPGSLPLLYAGRRPCGCRKVVARYCGGTSDQSVTIAVIGRGGLRCLQCCYSTGVAGWRREVAELTLRECREGERRANLEDRVRRSA